MRSNTILIEMRLPQAARLIVCGIAMLVIVLTGIAAQAAPAITKLSVTSGPVGTPVTITGTAFGATQGTSKVTFNGTTATVTTWSATSIAVTVPAAATTGNVVVTVSGTASNGIAFTVTPHVTTLSFPSGPAQMGLIITGTTFGAAQGASTITLNGTTMPVITWTSTTITAQVPTGGTTGNIVVKVAGNSSNTQAFTVTAYGCT
jgi:hypothetical protein